MKLSIAILFCDKDYIYIPHLLSQIQTNVHVDYEIILIDNRDTFSRVPLEIGNSIYFSFGYNARQVQGRKKAVELATGDYIWFVDADDEVLKVSQEMNNDLSQNYDIITFGHELFFDAETPTVNTVYDEDEVCTNILDGQLLDSIGLPCWNKWIKKSVLEQVESHVPENVDAIASEDSLLVIGSLKYGNTLLKKTCCMYKNRIDRSTSAAVHYYSSEVFSRIIYGHSESAEIILSMLTDEDKSKIGYEDMLEKDCAFFIERLIACEPSIRSECIEIIGRYFTIDVITSSWRNNAWILPQWTKESFLDIREKFQTAYPNNAQDFISINTITHWTLDENGNRVIRDIEQTENLPSCFNL